jgi:sulfur relay (sulfurtransferase) DsrF/TusC family protein
MTLSDLVIKTEIVDRARLSALLQRFDLVLGR